MAIHNISGVKINITQSLRNYVEIQRVFSEETDKTLKVIEENAKYYESVSSQINHVIVDVKMLCEELISSLDKEYGYHNCIEEDLLHNKGYIDLYTIQQEYEAYYNRVKENNSKIENFELAQAARLASSNIRGVGFGLITNSLASYILYDISNKIETKRQINEARRVFEQQEKEIHAAGKQRVDNLCHDYYNRVFMPKLMEATQQIYIGALVKYLEIHEKLGRVDMSLIRDVDYGRSIKLLSNITTATDPSLVIATALSTCPFNIEIYVQAKNYGLLKREHIRLAEDLGIEDEVAEIVFPRNPTESETILEETDKFFSYEIDDFEDSWKMRANGYLRDSRSLIARYPESFVGYGWTAAHLIASNWDNRDGWFWGEVKKNIEKLFDTYTGYEDYSSELGRILSKISSYFETYLERAEKEIRHSWSHDSDYELWLLVFSVKKSEVCAIEVYNEYITMMEKSFEDDSRYVAREKNNLLWHVYRFCMPYMYQKSIDGTFDNLEKRYFHIPLSEREKIINLYDSLIASGVGEYHSGTYAFKKEYGDLKEIENIYGADIDRYEITDEGMKYWEGGKPKGGEGGCYIATSIYGTYNCPPVWTLRRFRDNTLAESWYGRTFIRIYYAISPRLVKWFGETEWFKKLWKPALDCMVKKLNKSGVEDTPYDDMAW